MTNVLVTGGAGYIGSHACKMLAEKGYTPVTYDNLATGWAEAVRFGPFEQGDLLDRDRLDAVFARHAPVAVMHFAASSLVGESMQDPARYWRNNLGGSLALAEAAVAAGCRNMVFSSTCAIYGDQDATLDETSAQAPMNTYAATKRAIEDMLGNFDAAHGLRSVVFRYFNVAGADPEGAVGEAHMPETHLIPVILEAIDGQRPRLTIHGTDYPTPDGTCIRDYIHVIDLVEAHILGLEWLLDGRESRVFNLGTKTGYSVREVIERAQAITGRPVPHEEGPRRAGDPSRLVSGSGRAAEELGWQLRHSELDTMIADAWRWHRAAGYGPQRRRAEG